MTAYIRKCTAAAVLMVLLAGMLGFSAGWGTAFAADGLSLQAGEVPAGNSDNIGDPNPNPEDLKNGWEKSGDVWHYWRNGEQVKGDWINTTVPPTDMEGGKSSAQNYWIDCDGNLAVNRLINPELAQDKSPKAYLAYATEYGYVATGKKRVTTSSGTIMVYLAKKGGDKPGLLETGNKYGILKTGEYDEGNVRYYYIDPSKHCAIVKQTPVQVKGFGYVLPCNKGGYLATGRKVMGNKVYLARENGKLETGNKLGLLSSKRYDSKGVSRRYYINPKTHAITYGKPVKAKGFGWTYAPTKAGYLVRGITRVDSKHVILADKEGRICNKRGWVSTSKYSSSRQRYWLEPTKKNKKVLGARVGYFKVDGQLYLGQKKGNLLRNTYHLKGRTYYYANNSGALWRDDVVTHLYREAQGHWSPSQYLLMVDIDDPKVLVLEGYQGNWNVKFIWDCCTGAPSTPTVEGTFAVGDKGFSFGEGNGYSCYYWTQIYGGYLFHTRLYYAYTWNLMDPTIGERCSHGCVRMYTDDAKWIWDNVPSGTTVACIY